MGLLQTSFDCQGEAFESDVKTKQWEGDGERETTPLKTSTQDVSVTWPPNSHFGEACWTWTSLMCNRKGLTVLCT